MAVHKLLTDIEYRLAATLFLHHAQPDAHTMKQRTLTANFLDLRLRRFYVQHGRQVSVLEAGVPQEVSGLSLGRGEDREEVISAHLEAMAAGCHIVRLIIRIEHRTSLGSLDIDEAHGIVHLVGVSLFAAVAQVYYAQLLPLYGVGKCGQNDTATFRP